MNTPTKTPDLLTPVIAEVSKLTGKEKAALAVELDISVESLRRLADKSRPFGPSYQLVTALYDRLIVKAA